MNWVEMEDFKLELTSAPSQLQGPGQYLPLTTAPDSLKTARDLALAGTPLKSLKSLLDSETMSVLK